MTVPGNQTSRRPTLYRLLAILNVAIFAGGSFAVTLNGRIVDEGTSQMIAARIYLQDAAGKHVHVQCNEGTAIPYERRRAEMSYEVHTTVSAHPFHVELPAGKYTFTVEKGKEYVPTTRTVSLTDQNAELSITIPLKRWIDMSERGWYSGETHVHRNVAELPTLQMAEDINVAFPLTAWVTDSEHTPATHNKNDRSVPAAKLVRIDKTHVFWPVNTEYEIFSVRGRQHTLGAVFILNHHEPLTLPAPPVGPIAKEARRQGAFLELDKHNWPWSMMLIPQMEVELYELANNHMWRTDFLYKDWYPEYVGQYMNVEMRDGSFTERGWIEFGFENYYALLNCGFKMQPTAGTASGVHPVPFGFGRVYVHVDGGFSYEKWILGLLAGQSFVTTGPMLIATAEAVDGSLVRVSGMLESTTEPSSLEIVVNGRVVTTIDAQPQRTAAGSLQIPFETQVPLPGSSWVAVRAFAQRAGNRISFAHTAPVYFDDADRPLRPTRDQRDYLVKRVRDELKRSGNVVARDATSEFKQALLHFESLSVEN